MTKITAARMAWRREVGYRLRIARKNADFTLEEVGKKLGFGKQNIAGWESAATEVKTWDIARAAKLYQVSIDELLTGKAAGASTTGATSNLIPRVPSEWLLTVAMTFAEGLANPVTFLQSMAPARFPAAVENLSDAAFAFDAFDAGLEPYIDASDVVVVDRGRGPAAGEACLFFLAKTKELKLRRYLPSDGKKPGAPFTLEAENSKLIPPLLVTPDHKPFFLGSVAQITKLPTRSPARDSRVRA